MNMFNRVSETKSTSPDANNRNHNGHNNSSIDDSMEIGDEDGNNSFLDCNDDSCDTSVCTEGSADSSLGLGSQRRSKRSRNGRKTGGSSSSKNSGSSSQLLFNGSSSSSADRFNYKYSNHVKEIHNQPIFGVTFNPYLEKSEGRYVFAVTGSNRVSTYECLKDGSLKLLQTFHDPDREESFYCCVWSYDDESFEVLLMAAGARGIIRIIQPTRMKFKQLKGHGHSINDLKIHPLDSNLLLSVSKDHSLRLWNIKTNICVAIFGGVEGHRDEVLSADFHKRGFKIISCGMDHSLKIWSLETEEVKKSIKESYTYNEFKSKEPFGTPLCHFPEFTTRDIHRNYVDCVMWYGNFVLSKSCENSIVCWKPGKLDDDLIGFCAKSNQTSDSAATFIHSFELKDSEIWYMRFSMDSLQETMALGNMAGKTYVWDLKGDDPEGYRCIVLSHPKCNTALRQTSLSSDGSILICVSDDATIWRWDRETIGIKSSTKNGSTS